MMRCAECNCEKGDEDCNWIVTAKQTPQERLEAELAKPYEAEPRADGVVYSDDEFSPWALFPCVYGSYGSDFDKCAIAVLTEIRDRDKHRRDLGAEMFREMLCTAGFCDYGSSPRVCVWALDESLLRKLIERWAEWSSRHWGADSNRSG